MTATPAMKIKSKAAAFAPQKREEIEVAIEKIGVAQRERTRIQAEMNDELAVLKRDYEEKAKPFAEEISTLSKGVQAWCESHRDDLTRAGKVKTSSFTTGEVSWRITPPKVLVKGAEAVLDALRRFGLDRFIRTKEEINKEAILNEPEAVVAVKGVSITQSEEFVIKPFESQLEEVM